MPNPIPKDKKGDFCPTCGSTMKAGWREKVEGKVASAIGLGKTIADLKGKSKKMSVGEALSR